jgi:hypothetical protein
MLDLPLFYEPSFLPVFLAIIFCHRHSFFSSNDELKLSLRQSGYSVQLALTGYNQVHFALYKRSAFWFSAIYFMGFYHYRYVTAPSSYIPALLVRCYASVYFYA